ncbi:MAG: hypothetical protein NC826_03480 [Candidatus Omnitrophica bacterium]|nr:hypothetical protein [Candidatus Omnitrophota bacterium]
MANLIARKIWRIGGLIFPVIYITTDSQSITSQCSFYVLVFFILIELLRFLNSNFNVWLFKRFRLILKEEERHRFLNTTFFLLFLTITVWIFKKEVVIYSVFFIIFGDIAASITGRYFGHIKIKNKTLEGTVAFWGICLVSGYLLNLLTPIKLPLIVIVIAGGVAAIVELFSIIDDNLSTGLASCIAMEIMLRIIY